MVSFEKRLHKNAAFFRFQKRSLKHVRLLRTCWNEFGRVFVLDRDKPQRLRRTTTAIAVVPPLF